MHRRNLIWLVLLVAALGAFAWWQSRREARVVAEVDRPLLEGFDRASVTALQVDNLERSLQLRMQMQPDGTFRIVDPVDFPAEPAVVELLFDLLAHQRATVVENGDAKKLGLDPPRAVVSVEARANDSTRTRRIELGAVDLDRQHAFARVDGRIVRTERGLDSALERDLPDWRARRILHMAPTAAVELHRRGHYQPVDEKVPYDLALDAVLDGTWRATAPFSAQLQNGAVALLLSATAWLRADSFVDNPAGLEVYGLDHPAIEVEVLDVSGTREVLRLSQERGREQWFAMRAGSPEIFRVSGDAVGALAPPSTQLIDRKLIDVPRERIDSIDLAADGRSTTLTRVGGSWKLVAREGERTLIDGEPADGDLVADLLGEIERARIATFLFDGKLEDASAIASIRVHAAGDVQGGILGALFRTSDGAEGVPFRRDGDLLVSALDPKLLEIARTDPEKLRSLELHRASELDVARIELHRGAVERTYNRNAKGQWSRAGNDLEAKDFARLVDRVLSMRAMEVLKRGFDDVLEDPIDVRIVGATGKEHAFTLGRMPDPAGGEPRVVYRTDSRLARVKPELYGDLRELLSRE